MSSAASSTPNLFQNLVGDFYSRRLLLHTSNFQTSIIQASPPPATSTSESYNNNKDNSFDTNVVMVLSVLLCALICSLGLNSIIRCALRCSRYVSSDSSRNNHNPSSGLASSRGVERKAIKTFPIVHYSTSQLISLPGFDSECIICLSEFTDGDRVRLLPTCNHGFHVKCIDKWLSSHSSCPKCRHCLIETCQKIMGCRDEASSSEPPPPPLHGSIVSIMSPLEPESLIRNFRC